MGRGVNSQPSHILWHAIIGVRVCIRISIKSSLQLFTPSLCPPFLTSSRVIHSHFLFRTVCGDRTDLIQEVKGRMRRQCRKPSHVCSETVLPSILVRMRACIWRSFIPAGVKIIPQHRSQTPQNAVSVRGFRSVDNDVCVSVHPQHEQPMVLYTKAIAGRTSRRARTQD